MKSDKLTSAEYDLLTALRYTTGIARKHIGEAFRLAPTDFVILEAWKGVEAAMVLLARYEGV